jgi:hypothetical protein
MGSIRVEGRKSGMSRMEERMKQRRKLIDFLVLIAIWGMTVDTVRGTAALSPDAYSWRYDLMPVAGQSG